MTNAVIYARYSSYNQTERSIEGQIEDCQAFAKSHDYNIIGVYIDRKKTGTEADHRSEFQRMMSDSERKLFQKVLVWKFDRFARNRYDFAIYKTILRKNGAEFESIKEPVSDDPAGILLGSLYEGLAEYYSANLAQNVRRGIRIARERGTFSGGILPFGYESGKDKKIRLSETEAPIMRQVFRDYADGKKMSEIVNDLNARGIRPRLGVKFTNASLQHTLANRKYIGEYFYDGEAFPDLYPRLIDDETFNAVQRRKDEAKRAPAASKSYDYLLQGKCFCGMCGAPMVGESGRSKTGAIYHYYACTNKKKLHTCQKRNERAEDLEDDVISQTLAKLKNPENLRKCAEGLKKASDRGCTDADIKSAETALAKINKDLSRCTDLLLSGELNSVMVAQINERSSALSAQKEDAERDLAALRMQGKHRYTVEEYEKMIICMLDGSADDPDFRKRIIHTFVNVVYVFDDYFLIYFNIDGVSDKVPLSEVSDDLENLIDESSGFISPSPPKYMKSENPLIYSEVIFGFLFTKIKSILSPRK